MSRDTFHQTRLLSSPSSLALNTAREGAATAFLGSLGQGLTTLTGKNFFLISHLNLPSFSLQPFPLVLSLHTLVKSPSPSFLQAPLGTGSCYKVISTSPLPHPAHLHLGWKGTGARAVYTMGHHLAWCSQAHFFPWNKLNHHVLHYEPLLNHGVDFQFEKMLHNGTSHWNCINSH